MSDHKYITIELNKKVDNPNPVKSRGWKYKSTDEGRVTESLTRRIRDNKPTNYEELGEMLQNICQDALRKPRTGRKKEIYWWSEQIANSRKMCTQNRRKLTRARKKLGANEVGRERTEQDINEIEEEYKKSKKKLKNEIQKAKNAHWEALCKDIDNDIWGKGYRIATKHVKVGRARTNIALEKMLEVCDILFPAQETQDWIQTEPREFEPIETEEIVKAENKIRSKKAPGPDDIPPEVVKVIAKKEPEILKDIFNKLLREGYFPQQWKIARIILIPKSKKQLQD